MTPRAKMAAPSEPPPLGRGELVSSGRWSPLLFWPADLGCCGLPAQLDLGGSFLALLLVLGIVDVGRSLRAGVRFLAAAACAACVVGFPHLAAACAAVLVVFVGERSAPFLRNARESRREFCSCPCWGGSLLLRWLFCCTYLVLACWW